MLILRRRIGEKVLITDKRTGERIAVMPLDVRDGMVRIGFEAERDRYEIHREEVQRKIEEAAT